MLHFLLECSSHSFSFYCKFQSGLWGHAIIVLKLQELPKLQSTAEKLFSKGTSPDYLVLELLLLSIFRWWKKCTVSPAQRFRSPSGHWLYLITWFRCAARSALTCADAGYSWWPGGGKASAGRQLGSGFLWPENKMFMVFMEGTPGSLHWKCCCLTKPRMPTTDQKCSRLSQKWSREKNQWNTFRNFVFLLGI